MANLYDLNLRQAIYALSDALDYVGVDELAHSKRVAYLATEMGRTLGLAQEPLDRLTEAALLHDCGVSSTWVHERLVSELDWEGSRQHCLAGHALLRNCPTLAPYADVVLHHHTHWNDLQEASIAPDEATAANLIFLADRVDVLVLQLGGRSPLLHREAIRERLAGLAGTLFAPHLVDVFLHISQVDAMWLMLQGEHVKDYLRRWYEPDIVHSVDFETLKGLAVIFAHIVDAKSAFTAEHSIGVARLSRYLGGLFELPLRRREMLEIAGMLHDLGKLRVPDEVLDKPGPLDPEEFLLIRQHSFDTFAILRQIKGFGEIARWAGDHHETMGGSGYPYGHAQADLPLESRILAVADIFQALAQNRPYRKPMDPAQIIGVLHSKAKRGELDPVVVDRCEENLHRCWQAALDHLLDNHV